MTRYPAYRLLIFLVLLVGFGACKEGGCSKEAAIPATPEARVEQLTSKLPGSADTVVVIKDLAQMRASLQVIKERLPNTGVIESFQKQVQAAFGIDLLDAESWKRAGVAPDSSAVVAVHRSRMAFLMYVENRQAFEKTLVEKAKAAYGIESVTKTEKVGTHSIKVLSDDPKSQIAWMYQGKLALVSMPAIDKASALEDGSVKMVLTEIADTKKEGSVWSDKGFQAFRSAVVDKYPIAIYMNPKASLDTDKAKEAAVADPQVKAMSEWAKTNVTFIGAGIQATGDQATVRAYLGLAPEVLASAKAAQKADVQHNWDSFATEKLLLGARISLNVEGAYALVMAAMGEDQKRAMRRQLKSAGEAFAVDIEKDVIAQLAGHVGVFFYGIAGGNPMALMGAAQNPAAAMQQLGIMGVLKFKSAEAVDALLVKVLENSGGAYTVRPFVNLPTDSSFKVLSPAAAGIGNFFIHGDTVAFASTAFGDEAMHKYLTAARDDKKLSAMEGLDLGKAFGTGDKFSGLYFNSARAQDNLGTILAMGGVGQILASIEEASLSIDTDDQGVFAHLAIDLVPAPKAAPADAAPQK